MSREILGKVNEMCIKSIILITIGFSVFAQNDLIFTSGQVSAILTIIIFIVRALRVVFLLTTIKKGFQFKYMKIIYKTCIVWNTCRTL